MMTYRADRSLETHCRKCGRALKGDNLYRTYRGTRTCKHCRNERSAEWRAAAAARKALGLPSKQATRRNVWDARKTEETPKQVPIDHATCDPNEMDSLCDDCAEMFNAARRATA